MANASLSSIVANNSTEVSLSNLKSGNGSNRSNIKRMEIAYGDTSIKFAINPEDYNQKEPNRATLTQTKGGAWIDAWGAGIVEFTLKGITGVSGRKMATTTETLTQLNTTSANLNGDSGVDTGYQRWKQLRDLFRGVFNSIKDGEEVTELIRLYNYTDNEYWYCYPTQSGIELYRSKARPHVYQYTISLWGIRKIGEPETSVGVIGNPAKETTTTEIDNSTEEDENNDNNSTTTKEVKTEVSGGNIYRTASVALNTEADVTIITNTRTKTNYVLRNQSHSLAQLIAPLIGGSEGKIAPVTGYDTAKELKINDAGVVYNVQGFKGKDLLKEGEKSNFLIEEITFGNVVSIETYDMWKRMLQYDPDILSPEYTYPVGATPKERVIQAIAKNRTYDSTIYDYITQYKPKYYLTKSDINLLKTILLESMMVYIKLEKICNSHKFIEALITPTGMRTLIKNIQAVIMYFEYNSTDVNKFYTQNISAELRQLESLMLQVYADVVIYL